MISIFSAYLYITKMKFDCLYDIKFATYTL